MSHPDVTMSGSLPASCSLSAVSASIATTLMDERYKGKTFVEASDSDDIWGIGSYITDEVMAFNEDVWMGTNLLGKTLTRVRNEHL